MNKEGNLAIYDDSWKDLGSSPSSLPPQQHHHHQQQHQVDHLSSKHGDMKRSYVAFLDIVELKQWSFYRACIAEFLATLLFLYITINTIVGNSISASHSNGCSTSGVGIQGIAWAFGGMIFILVYCIAGISGGHINPAVTFALLLARRVSLPRAFCYIIAQCFGAILGVWIVSGYQPHLYDNAGGGTNVVAHGYSKATGLGAEIIGTFVLVYTVLSATDPKRSHDPYIVVLAPLAIGFSVYMVHLATIPITGTGINPARSLGAAVIYNHKKIWHEHWIFWVGPFIGAALATSFQELAITREGNAP